MWQSPIGKQAVPHWASMLRWIWSISEYNLKTRDSQKQTSRRVTCYSGNIEGADLKNNSQSTTHIDPKVGTGEKPRVLTCFNWLKPRVTINVTAPTIGPFCQCDLVTSGGAGKIRHLLTVCLTKVHTIDWNPNGVSIRSYGFSKPLTQARLLLQLHHIILVWLFSQGFTNQNRKISVFKILPN